MTPQQEQAHHRLLSMLPVRQHYASPEAEASYEAKRTIQPGQVDRWKRLRAQGLSFAAISEKVGISESTIRGRLSPPKKKRK